MALEQQELQRQRDQLAGLYDTHVLKQCVRLCVPEP